MNSDSDGMTCRANDHQGGAIIRKAKALERQAEKRAERDRAKLSQATSALQRAEKLAREARVTAAIRYADKQAAEARAITEGWFRK
jgi:hypothetical protein